jgi:hypothetical protein
MVDAHPQIAVVSEIRWLAPRFRNREGLTPEGFVTPAFFSELKYLGRFNRLPTSEQELAEFSPSKRAISYADFMSLLFDRYGQKKGKALVAIKNADHAIAMDIQALHTLWPNAKFVHLIRDGRDVCLSVLSWRLVGKLAELCPTWNESPVFTVALWWEWQVRSGRRAGIPLGSQLYREVSYEFMVAHPAETCAQLCAFIGAQYHDSMVRFWEGRVNRAPGLDAKRAWLPPTPGLRDWRLQMPSGDVAQFEAVAGNLLDELGYPRGIDHVRADLLEMAARMRAQFKVLPPPENWRGKTETKPEPVERR